MMRKQHQGGRGFEDIFYRTSEVLDRLVEDFRSGQEMKWEVVPRHLLHRVWSGFIDHGRVQDERGLDNVLGIMRDCLCRLQIATIVFEHDAISPVDFMSDHMDSEEEIGRFAEWLAVDQDGHWRISDYGIEGLTTEIARAIDARRPEDRLKFLDRALHVVHCRGDLSRLFVEGGRSTMLEFDVDAAEEATEAKPVLKI